MLNDGNKTGEKLQFAIAFFWNIRYYNGKAVFGFLT
jgi:hypothetical protein